MSLLRISFAQHKNLITVKFLMGCSQLNEKLVSHPKIGLTAETILKRKMRSRLSCQVLYKIFSLQKNMTVKLSIG